MIRQRSNIIQNHNKIKLLSNPIQININISKKYQFHFNFFLAKSITHIVYDSQHTPEVIQFKDVMLFMESNELLKRYYQIKNNYGRNQVQQRIKILANFYAQNPMISFQYPTMIISNTKTIFQRRLKRIQKNQNGYDSSNDDDQQSQNQQITSICGSFSYLKSQPSQQLQRKSQVDQGDKHSNKHNFLNESNYSISVHNVYESFDQDQYSNNKLKPLFHLSNIIPLDKQLNHLVCDFQDIDQQRIKKQYEQFQNKKRAQNKQSIKALNFNPQDKMKEIIFNKQVSSSKNTIKISNSQQQYNLKGSQKKGQISSAKNTTNNQLKISIHKINKDKNIDKIYSVIGSPRNNQFEIKNYDKKIEFELIKQPKNEEININQQKSQKQLDILKIIQKHRNNSAVLKQQSKKIQQIQQRRKQIEQFKSKHQVQSKISLNSQQNRNYEKRLIHVKSQTRLHNQIQGGKKLDLNKLIVTQSKQELNIPLTNKNAIVSNKNQHQQNIRNTDSELKINSQNSKYQYHIKNNNFMQKQTTLGNQKMQSKLQNHSKGQSKRGEYKYMMIKNSGKEEQNNYFEHKKKLVDNYYISKEDSNINNISSLTSDIKYLKHAKSTENLNRISLDDQGTSKQYKSKWKN